MKPSQNVNSIAMGLVLLITGTNVEANSNHHRSHLHSTGGFGIGAITKFNVHKNNSSQCGRY
ncbi:MAG: hypothetical protein WAM42_12170 [Candidatus Nitrosopolaris sp.]